jgi:SAM-dependent methyltransferase
MITDKLPEPILQNQARLAKLAGSPLAHWTLCHLKTEKDASVLDLGCGTDMKRILKKIPEGHIVGFYDDKIFADWAKKENKGALETGQAHVFYKEGEKIPFDSSSFDAVTAIESLYGCQQPALLFSEVWRVLKPGGMILIGNSDGGRGLVSQVRRKILSGYKAYTLDELVSLLYQAGFVNPKFETRLGAFWLSMEKPGEKPYDYRALIKPMAKKIGIAALLAVLTGIAGYLLTKFPGSGKKE